MMGMTLLQLHRHDLHGTAGGGRATFAQAFRRLHAALRLIHQSIKVAKLRRLQSELMFHADDGGDESADQNAARYPQRPLILSDKWDF
jgi:hypothetical protein